MYSSATLFTFDTLRTLRLKLTGWINLNAHRQSVRWSVTVITQNPASCLNTVVTQPGMFFSISSWLAPTYFHGLASHHVPWLGQVPCLTAVTISNLVVTTLHFVCLRVCLSRLSSPSADTLGKAVAVTYSHWCLWPPSA